MSKRQSNTVLPLWKKMLFIFLSITFSFCIFFVIAELGMRIFLPQQLIPHPKNLYTASSTLGYKNNPGFTGIFDNPEYSSLISINSISLRDKEVLPKSSNTFRILGLGDSFTFASQVESREIYLKVFEKLLNRFPFPNNLQSQN